MSVIRTPTARNKAFCVQENNAPRGIKRARKGEEGGGHAGIPGRVQFVPTCGWVEESVYRGV